MVLPGVGTFVGGVIGGVVGSLTGDTVGKKVSGKIYDHENVLLLKFMITKTQTLIFHVSFSAVHVLSPLIC